MQSNGPLKQVLEHVVEYKERRPGLIAWKGLFLYREFEGNQIFLMNFPDGGVSIRETQNWRNSESELGECIR